MPSIPPYRAVIVDGAVTVEDVDADIELSAWLATYYFGRVGGNEYRRMTAEDNARTGICRITIDPLRVRGFDNHRLIGRGLRLYMRLREMLSIPRSWL